MQRKIVLSDFKLNLWKTHQISNQKTSKVLSVKRYLCNQQNCWEAVIVESENDYDFSSSHDMTQKRRKT
jgi:hypothetical protein